MKYQTTTERVAEIRKQLKSEFPQIKFSITKRHYNAMTIAIMEAPCELSETGYEQVNEYWIHEHYEGVKKDILMRIKDIAFTGISYRETGDYGNQPDFYVSIHIGKWDKKFICTGNKTTLGTVARYVSEPQQSSSF